jgi:hypothetical protein
MSLSVVMDVQSSRSVDETRYFPGGKYTMPPLNLAALIADWMKPASSVTPDPVAP